MIPKIIHLCWLSGEDYPDKIKKCIESWHKYLPDYEIVLWDKSRFDINSIRWTREAYAEGKYAFAADYIRYYALYNYGGIYLDSDVEVKKCFDDLLNYRFFWGFEYTGCPEAAIIGAEPKQKWLKKCMEWYEKHSFDELYDKKMIPIAPLVMRMAFEKTFRCRTIDDNRIHKAYGGIILPYEYFSPKNVFDGKIHDSEKKYTIHHFSSSWIDNVEIALLKNKVHVFVMKYFGKRFYNAVTYYILGFMYKKVLRLESLH